MLLHQNSDLCKCIEHKATHKPQKFVKKLTPSSVFSVVESNRKAMNRNWSNQKANPALKTKAGNK